MKIEKRDFGRPVELRAAGDGPPAITGYAAVFYRDGDPATQYQLWPGAFERVLPTAFDEALKRGDDVRALFNHDPALVLGRSKSGTLALAVDAVGLRYEITPAETGVYRDLAESLKRGDVDGSSFSFSIIGEDVWYRDADGNEIRELRNLKLYDVGPVTFPAYAGASSGARAETREARDEWANKVAREKIERERYLRLTTLRQFR